MKEKRDFWVDAFKAICMICVYVYHTGFYYGIDYHKLTQPITPFYVNGFFFISGYLLFKSFFKKDIYLKKDFIKSFKNILFKLVIPTLLFSIIAYLAKYRGISDINHFCILTFGGTSFWFTSALSISQIAITLLLLSNRKNIWLYLFLSVIILVLINTSGKIGNGIPVEEYFPWFWQTGLLYIFIMCLGGIYYKYEHVIIKFINRAYIISSLLLSYVGILYYSSIAPTYCFGLSGKNNFMGIIGTILAILILIYITQKIRRGHLFQFIGKHSIIFYFLSGIVPITISAIANHFITEKTYIIYTCVTAISLGTSCFIAYIISKYFSFVTDLRNWGQTKYK